MCFLAELDPESKPDAIAFVEVHLRGTDLNATRRRVKQLGWRMMATPAVTKAELRVAAGEQPREQGGPEQVEHDELEEANAAKFHNSGGEANPHQPFQGGDRTPSAEGGLWLPQCAVKDEGMNLTSDNMLFRLWMATGSRP